MVKKMTKEIKIQPYLKDMTYDENAWLIIDCKTGDTPYVSFYNPGQDSDKEFESLSDFAQLYIENAFKRFDDSKIEYKDNTATASGCSVSEGGDYDEETGRSWKTMDSTGQVIEVMTSVKLENIQTEVQQVMKQLISVEKDGIEMEQEAALERKDPYAYRGLSQKDFM